jgi:hypothetical protein
MAVQFCRHDDKTEFWASGYSTKIEYVANSERFRLPAEVLYNTPIDYAGERSIDDVIVRCLMFNQRTIRRIPSVAADRKQEFNFCTCSQ